LAELYPFFVCIPLFAVCIWRLFGNLVRFAIFVFCAFSQKAASSYLCDFGFGDGSGGMLADDTSVVVFEKLDGRHRDPFRSHLCIFATQSTACDSLNSESFAPITASRTHRLDSSGRIET
jgi:hypothetical protein